MKFLINGNLGCWIYFVTRYYLVRKLRSESERRRLQLTMLHRSGEKYTEYPEESEADALLAANPDEERPVVSRRRLERIRQHELTLDPVIIDFYLFTLDKEDRIDKRRVWDRTAKSLSRSKLRGAT